MLDAELASATETYAQSAALHVELGEGMKVVSAGAIPFETQGGEVVVPLGSLYAGRERKLWLTVQVPADATRERELGKLRVRYVRAGEAFEVRSGALPKVKSVADEASFEAGLVPAVWKRAVLEEEITRAREELGDAIARGTARDIDGSVGRVERQRALAEKLAQSDVVEELSKLEREGEQAKVAQQAEPALKTQAAKRAKATGYGQRNASKYGWMSFGEGY